ncbi:hypothetical protein GCM10022225_49700 [Plantactinospora mayteni]|uniref:Schlafen AlbA-2 domain-containing protein n=1 Tax=Plantactinospora mayteni TaxID=566021 RepID=A0ABQ4EXT1_9ACTN|nr:hypothetical protein [Plantactinospora mayteni]GIG99468.1 hypothetical protein Pma05_60410 [Plantactinospora mayteni]
MQGPNERLRQARLARLSPSGSGRAMSRQELAEAVNAVVFAATGVVIRLNANYIGKLELGVHRWPAEPTRRAFRAVLDAGRDADLGFFIVYGTRTGAGNAPRVQVPERRRCGGVAAARPVGVGWPGRDDWGRR